jgi:hypothetical protein
VPVTAKLSRKFYERFGDDITTELVDWFNAVDETYRNQLKEINELNWERFKAHLDARIAEVRADMKTELASLGKGLREEFQNKFAATDARITKLETGFQKELRRVHEDILKWMFIYWTGLFLALCGVGVGIATYLRH